jgi:RimJ/RimL family protein N-acetyltransferase
MTGNTPAQRAYEKVGFRVDRDYGDPSFEDFFDSPGMTRMLLEL